MYLSVHVCLSFYIKALFTLQTQDYKETLCTRLCLCTDVSVSMSTYFRGGVLPSKRLLGMCRWMGLHFHNWTDYNGVTFLVELLEWGRKFSGFLG